MDTERTRYLDLLDSLELDPRSPDELRTAVRRVDDLRFAARQRSDGKIADDAPDTTALAAVDRSLAGEGSDPSTD